VAGTPLLKPAARHLTKGTDEVFVSAASIWEIAIQARLGKFEVDPHELAAAIDASGLLRSGLSSYDAAYLELALRRQLPPATQDEALRAAALAAEVGCVEAVS